MTNTPTITNTVPARRRVVVFEHQPAPGGDRTGRGALRPVVGRVRPETPTHRGTVRIDGTRYRIAAWERDGDEGPWWELRLEPWDRAEVARRIARERRG